MQVAVRNKVIDNRILIFIIIAGGFLPTNKSNILLLMSVPGNSENPVNKKYRIPACKYFVRNYKVETKISADIQPTEVLKSAFFRDCAWVFCMVYLLKNLISTGYSLS
jgi:hypothetical protein